MSTVARTRIVKIGNSKGVRIPKLLLDQLELGEEVELAVEEDQLIIRPVCRSRDGWDAAFRDMAKRGDDRMPDETAVSLTKWDKDEWEWT
ncbi:MAG: AbrB/MazE/SpoVT family DNA-binding domain-containing protein [Acidobacteriota bacterium]|nr:AbrB/MazE/SpoVT family DNA-binding domain-containing protein [Acidobacteriota bacterium]